MRNWTALFLTVVFFSSCHTTDHQQRLNIVSPAADEKQNAAHYYEAAAQAIVPLAEEIRKQNAVLDQAIHNGWTPETAASAEELLRKSDFALSLFRQGTEIQAANLNFSRQDDVKPTTSPACLELKWLATLLLVKAKQMENAGLSAEAVKLYINTLRFVDYLGRDPQTLSKVTALAVEKNICLAVRQAAEKKILDRRDRNALRENLLIFRKAHFPATDFVDAEQSFFMETIRTLAEEAQKSAPSKNFPSQRLIQKAGLLCDQYNENWRRALETNAPADWEKANAVTAVLKTRIDSKYSNLTELTGRFLVNSLLGKTEENQGLVMDQVVTYLYVIALANYQKMSDLYRDASQTLDAAIRLL
jgi:hypothetical protein